MLTPSSFQCKRCADCCKYLTVKLSERDISAIKKKGYEDFKVYDDYIKSFVLKRTGKCCVFLDRNKNCRIYSIRPKVCKDYPFVESDEVESCRPALLKYKFGK